MKTQTVKCQFAPKDPARGDRRVGTCTLTIPPLLAVLLASVSLFLSGCEVSRAELGGDQTAEGHDVQQHSGEHSEGHHAPHKVVATSPVVQDVVSTQQYVCQIHSRRHIEVCALEGGYLEEIHIREGQAVKQGDLMFKILPTLLQAKLDADMAEAQLAEIELKNSKKLFDQRVGGRSIVSDQDVALAQAKLAKAQANVELAQAELNFTDIKAPFDGIVDRQLHQQGSLIEEGDDLTTLSDNSVMWVYFNVPEARYLEYMANDARRDPQHPQQLRLPNVRIELRLADGRVFDQTAGDVVTIEGDFDNETGNIAFRADFPNPDGLLRHGQTGTILIHRTLHDAIVIPQRATFEILDKQYVYVFEKPGEKPVADGEKPETHGSGPAANQPGHEAVETGAGHVGEHETEHDKDHTLGRGTVHQRRIVVEDEMDDVFVIERGLSADDLIVLDGVRQIRDGDETEYEFLKPEEVFSQLKYHAE